MAARKLFLADHDLETLKTLKLHISKGYPQFEIARVYTDYSQDFFTAVKADKPSLIVCDIKFLGVRNTQIIRDIYELLPNTMFILYGTYTEEAYLNKALEYGAVFVIYKPLKPADVDNALEAAVEFFKNLEDKEQKEKEVFNSYLAHKGEFQTIFLTNLVKGHIKDKLEIDEALRYFNIRLQGKNTAIIIRMDSFKKIILTLTEQEKHLLVFKLCQIATEFLTGSGGIAFIKELNAVTVILSGNMPQEQIIELCEGIKAAIHDRLGFRVSIGIGRTYELTDLAVSYKEAESALRYRFHLGSNTVIPIWYVEPNNFITYRYPKSKEEKLVYTAVIGEYEYAKKLLKDIFDSLAQCEPLPNKLLPKIITNMLISINRYASELNMDLQNLFTTFFPSKEILEQNSISAAHEYMSEALKKFCEHSKLSHKKSDDYLLNTTKEYLEEKYFEGFSLKKIALSLNTTPEYLNNLFVEKEGKPLFEYVVGVRLNHAKKLLRETTLDDDMIAAKVGYDDARHFRSVFRVAEGMTTTIYRKNFKYHEG